jgi:hypothetical protein
MFAAAGCDRVVEHGRIVAEVAGLEVARASIGEDGEPVVEVGVGRFDREAHAMISGGEIDAARLADVVALVSRHRRPGAAPHPLNMLVPERALRARVVTAPGWSAPRPWCGARRGRAPGPADGHAGARRRRGPGGAPGRGRLLHRDRPRPRAHRPPTPASGTGAAVASWSPSRPVTPTLRSPSWPPPSSTRRRRRRPCRGARRAPAVAASRHP